MESQNDDNATAEEPRKWVQEERKRSDEEAVRQWEKSEHPWEDGARSFLNHVEACANISLLPPGCLNLPDDEAEALKFSVKQLRPAFNELTKWFIDPLRESRPSQIEFGYEKLWALLGAAFRIGTHATVTEGAKNYFRPEIFHEVMKSNTGPANEARRLKAIQEIIDKHAKALWFKKPGLRTNRRQTAREIRAAVSAEIDQTFGGNPPTGWQAADEKIEIDRIRKSVRVA